MRILLICDSFYSTGGVQEVVDQLAYEFKRHGHTVGVMSTRPPDKDRMARTDVEFIEQKIPEAKPTGWRHLERLVRWPAGSKRLVDRVRDWRPDIVSSHGGRWDKFPILVHACRLAHVPFVQTLHGTSFAGNLGEKALASLRRASALTSVSEAVRQFFSARVGNQSRITLIANAVDYAAAAAASPVRRDRSYIFSAARLDLRNKAIDALVSAFAMVASDFPEVDLLIAGNGPDRETLAAQVAALTGLQNRVELLGARGRDELWPLYKGSLFFAMPSRISEGEGLVFREAMACGKPVIGTRGGGTPELVREGVSGLLVGGIDPGEIASALRTLLANPALREEMGRAAQASVSSRGWPEVAARYLEVYTGSVTPR